MDPFTAISAVTQAVGFGMKLFGADQASKAASKAYEVEKNITGLERQVNDQRRNAMELSARRQSLEVFRNAQRLRAQGINAAVGQTGSTMGSGLWGGLASNTNQALFNAQGINQNLEIGRNIFGLNDKISDQKMLLSQYKTDQSNAQGLSSLGGSLLQSAGTIGDVTGGIYGTASKFASLMSPGSLSGGLTASRSA